MSGELGELDLFRRRMTKVRCWRADGRRIEAEGLVYRVESLRVATAPWRRARRRALTEVIAMLHRDAEAAAAEAVRLDGDLQRWRREERAGG